MDELRFFWNLVWNPGKYAKRRLDLVKAARLYYTVAILPFIAYVVLGFIATALGMHAHSIGTNSGILRPLYGIGSALSYFSVFWGGILLFFVVLPLGILIDAFIYQIVAKVFLNVWKGEYDATFSALVYGLFPILLLAWLSVIPLFSSLFTIIAPIWAIVIIVIALSEQQKVTRLNSLIVMLLKEVLVLLVFFLVGISIFSSVAYLASTVVPLSSVGPLSNITSGWWGVHSSGTMIPFNSTV